MIDPEILKDVEALKRYLDELFISPQQAIAAKGYDYETIMREIAKETEARPASHLEWVLLNHEPPA